jgi:hypothetical protein
LTANVAGFLTFSEKCADSVYFTSILESMLPEENISNLVRCLKLPHIIVKKSKFKGRGKEKVKDEYIKNCS